MGWCSPAVASGFVGSSITAATWSKADAALYESTVLPLVVEHVKIG